MSIRTKLLISYIAMIVAPAILFAGAAIVLYHLFFNGMTETHPYPPGRGWGNGSGVQNPQVFRAFFPLLFFSLLFVIALTNGLLTYFVSRSIIKPLYALKKAAEQIREGNLDYELKHGSKDEIGELSDTFEEMRLRLKDSISVQLQYEDNRRELIASISHDLKTPITAIAGCVEALRDGIADTPLKQEKYVNMIHNKVNDMDGLIDELFLFSKLDLRKMPFHYEEIELAAFLQDCVEDLRHHPGNEEISFIYESASSAPVFVMADREKLGRVVMNIAANSMKYMDKPEKEIRFTLEDGGGEAIVKIGDNGRGISESALPHVFERFYREEPSRNAGTGGSGLGLAIVKQIVEAHGGHAAVASRAGDGTVITFTLQKSGEYTGRQQDEADSDR